MLDRSRGREIHCGWPPFPAPAVAEARAAAESAVAQDAGRPTRPGRSQPGPAELPAAARTFPGRRGIGPLPQRLLPEVTWPKPTSTAALPCPTSPEGPSTSGSGRAPFRLNSGGSRSGAPRAIPTRCSPLPPPAPSWPAGKLSGRGSTPGSGPGPAWSSPANLPTTPRSIRRQGRKPTASSPKEPPSAASEIDAEVKSIVAQRSETARARDGKAAADIERMQAARDLGAGPAASCRAGARLRAADLGRHGQARRACP